MNLLDKVLSREMCLSKIRYEGKAIKSRIIDKENNRYYILEDGSTRFILPQSGEIAYKLHIQEGLPIDITRQKVSDAGYALEEEELQILINEEYIQQYINEKKKKARLASESL